VHRDIKPGNVIMSQHGRPQLADFGLSKRLDLLDDQAEAPRRSTQAAAGADLTFEGDVMGTPAYMSPEQARGEHRAVGPASDQYSLGVMLYELLTGQRPFVGTAIEVLDRVANHEPTPPRKLRPDVPQRLELICLRAMAREPEKRFADCGELAVALQQWLKESREVAARLKPVTSAKADEPAGASLAGLGIMGICGAIGFLLGCGYNLLDPLLWRSGDWGTILYAAFTASIAPFVGLLFGGLLGLAIHLKRD
jgi:serine/threonine protein kinase